MMGLCTPRASVDFLSRSARVKLRSIRCGLINERQPGDSSRGIIQ